MVSFSPHRFYGPKGVGVLYRNRKARIVSMIHGGVQEGGVGLAPRIFPLSWVAEWPQKLLRNGCHNGLRTWLLCRNVFGKD